MKILKFKFSFCLFKYMFTTFKKENSKIFKIDLKRFSNCCSSDPKELVLFQNRFDEF